MNKQKQILKPKQMTKKHEKCRKKKNPRKTKLACTIFIINVAKKPIKKMTVFDHSHILCAPNKKKVQIYRKFLWS